MKKILILSAFILFIFTSCKKKNDVVPVNTISATVDGAHLSFNTSVYAKFGGNSNSTLSIYGVTSSASDAQTITIGVFSDKAIAIGTYTYPSITGSSGLTEYPFIVYSDKGPTASSSFLFVTDNTAANPTTVTITSINSTNIQGTFTCTLIRQIGGTKTITNGKFNINISN